MNMEVFVKKEAEVLLSHNVELVWSNERFRDANSSYSGYKSAHAHKSTRVMQSRTTRVVNKMAPSYGY